MLNALKINNTRLVKNVFFGLVLSLLLVATFAWVAPVTANASMTDNPQFMEIMEEIGHDMEHIHEDMHKVSFALRLISYSSIAITVLMFMIVIALFMVNAELKKNNQQSNRKKE